MKRFIRHVSSRWLWFACAVVLGVVGWATRDHWAPGTLNWVQSTTSAFRPGGGPHADGEEGHDSHTGHDHDSHAGHDHDSHAGHDDASSLELSAQALRNIGLSKDNIRPVVLETFRRSITVPALVVERPGRTRVQVATPMTGVITHVHAVQGEAVEPGTLLFQIRLTHEDLVQAQTDFLTTLGELDVEEREIARLSGVTQSGAVAGKVLLEREYARDRLTAHLSAQREALRLHGLSEAQVEQIASERRLLRELQVFAPTVDDHGEDEFKLTLEPLQPVAVTAMPHAASRAPHAHTGPLILRDLDVHKGQAVIAGQTLCILTDYEELFIEGLAFEQDFGQIRHASERGWTVDAIFEEPGAVTRTVDGLQIAYIGSQIDVDSRTLRFYVNLPNEITQDRRSNGGRFVEWRYLPGQRLKLRVPVEEWADQIVLPVDAVAREGAEYFVFQQNGNHFDRVPVHVKYRDQYSAVIDNDGSIFPGDVVAMRGAHQMQMALKNKSGGGIDPHAGHNH